MDKKYAEFLIEKTKKDYDLIANDFSLTRSKVWEEIRFLIDEHTVNGDKVLDLGCGNGRLYEFFKQKNVDYIGVDGSEKLIRLAQKRYFRANFKVADALNLPFSDNYFNKIYSIAVFHQIPSYEFRLRFLKEARRVLLPGGTFILTVRILKSKKELFLILKYTILKIIGKSKLDFKDVFKSWGRQKVNLYYHFFSKRELKKIVKEAGFKVREIGIIKNKIINRSNIYLVAQK